MTGMIHAQTDGAAGEPPNTQQETIRLTTPAEALASIKVPDGFRVSLFAAEPDVRQPIAFCTDARGRLWIAENYTYAERPLSVDNRLRDRIVILEDVDHDGRSDRSTVFWDGAQELTSVEVGFGGVWAMCPPRLLFLPDADQDDRPDGPPTVMLDGFDLGAGNRHNFANGLKWGPDGWLYGRNGISHVGHVASPSTPPDKRIAVGPGIWRFHPQRKTVEVVCTGTTNPWGHDWNDYGELFFINTVIGHLWHAVPGAHFQRMFGADPNPYVYELIDQTADHFHWDTAEAWQEVRKRLSQSSAERGGGHAHSGLMIYLGDNWPDSFRGRMFTVNLHGFRLNCDRLERQGASYVGRHDPDFLFSSDPWFRGIDLTYGPDGGVYLADWSDIGECHENDGVHRTTGRIFKITYGSPSPRAVDLERVDSHELVRLQLHRNDWFVRQARRILQQRAASNADMAGTRSSLGIMFQQHSDPTRRLRALWCLSSIGGLTNEWLLDQLADRNEHVRAWIVRLLVDQGIVSSDIAQRLAHRANVDESGIVLLYLASALQRIQPADRWALAGCLSSRTEFAHDRVLPLMIWYGIEPAVPLQVEEAVELAASATIPLVRRHVARRIAQEWAKQPNGLDGLVQTIGQSQDAARQRDLLSGISQAMRGQRKVPSPASWKRVYEGLAQHTDEGIRSMSRELAAVFGDGRALAELKDVAASPKYDLLARRAAIQSLVDARIDDLEELLIHLLADQDIAAEAIRGLAAVNSHSSTKELLDRFHSLYPPGREAALVTLTGRPASAFALLEAIAQGKIDRSYVTVFQVRQMQSYSDPGVHRLLKKLWPELRPISADKKARMNQVESELSANVDKPVDLQTGRLVWERTCAKCHLLFGSGTAIGPDLTGSQRSNLGYLLENIIDPSATLAPNFRMSTIALIDGRVVQGVVLSKSQQAWEVQTPGERLVLAISEIAESKESELSLMPEGLLDLLTVDEVRNLFAYLASPTQVPLDEPSEDSQ
jgi:putative membrane-bound dehydrogenase-like protein